MPAPPELICFLRFETILYSPRSLKMGLLPSAGFQVGLTTPGPQLFLSYKSQNGFAVLGAEVLFTQSETARKQVCLLANVLQLLGRPFYPLGTISQLFRK